MSGQLPALRRWHVPVLRAVCERPGITAAEVGRLYRHSFQGLKGRERAALHELLELEALGLVQRSERPAGRWSPALFAAEALAMAEVQRR